MFKKLSIFSIIIALSTPAYAIFGDTYNNTDNSTNNNPVANGGTGVGVGIGVGGNGGDGGNAKANASGGTAIQGQIGINKNINKNTAKQSQDASSSNAISITGDTYKAPVNSAFAPVILPTSDCLNAISAGGTGQFFGFSLGFSKVAKDCNRRADANQWTNMGFEDVAFARMCQDKKNRKAVESTGIVCPESDIKKIVKSEMDKASEIEEACKYPTPTCKMLQNNRPL